MGHSFCAEKTGFGISEFLSFCDVAFCMTFRGHSDMDSNNINVTWCSLFSLLRKVMGDGSDHVLSRNAARLENTWLFKVWRWGQSIG